MKRIKQFQETSKKFSAGKGLKAKIARGSLWLGAGTGIDGGLRLLRNMILTRLLAPQVFGLMAIVLATDRIFETFTEIGIKKAIIQNPKGHEQTYLNGAWWFSIARAVALYAAAYVAAPFVAEFYANPKLVSLMRLAFLSILFNGAMSPRATVTIKEMNYGRWVLISQGSGIIGVLTTIVLAFVIGNVWALVIGFTAESAVRLLLSFLVCPYLPGFSFDRESLRALFKFARGMLGLPILTFIYKRADVFVIAKLCSAAELGLYSMAIALVIPLEGIISIMGKIVLPAFSKNQTEKDWINRATLHITSVIAYFCFPLLFFVTFYGKDLLYIVYGPQYAQVSGAFAIIFASWMMRTCGNPIVQVYWAMGRPELNRLFTGLRALLIIILIYPAVKWFGLVGAASASLISMVVAYFFQVLWVRRLTQLNLLQYGLIFIRAFGISLCILLVWFSTRNLSLPVPFLDLFPGAIGCLLAYGLGISLFLRYWKKAKIFLPPQAK